MKALSFLKKAKKKTEEVAKKVGEDVMKAGKKTKEAVKPRKKREEKSG